MIKTYNSKTFLKPLGKPPVISFQNGRISFSVEASKLYNLTVGDKISFYVNDEEKDIIYWSKTKDGLPIQIDAELKSGNRHRICNRKLSRELSEHFSVKNKKSFVVSKENANICGVKSFFILKSKQYKPLNKY
jgi:hypothetical protein